MEQAKSENALDESNSAATVTERVIEVLKTVYDPEIPVNIYDLGLIYEVKETEPGYIHVLMTLTSPMCPVAESLPPEVKEKSERVEGVEAAEVELTFEPPWNREMMSEAARLTLGF